MAKYSQNFLRDLRWFLKMRNTFNFDGQIEEDIPYKSNGMDFMAAFLKYDAQGKLVPTRHPTTLKRLIKVKGGVNLHIKMYAQDRARGYLPGVLFEELCKEIEAPDWFIKAVENQKKRYL